MYIPYYPPPALQEIEGGTPSILGMDGHNQGPPEQYATPPAEGLTMQTIQTAVFDSEIRP